MLRFLLVLVPCLYTAVLPAASNIDRLVAELERIRQSHDLPAFAFMLADRKRVLYANAHGLADRKTGRKANATTRFRIGSITKTFTALALLRAEQQGQLDLEARFVDTVGDGLLINPWAATRPIRLVHLLEHSAGLADLTHAEMYHSDPGPIPLATAVHQFKQERVVRWQPGEYYAYSNAGAGLAAYALEVSTGTQFDDYLRSQVLDALGMPSATVRLDEATAAQLATGYDSDKTTPIPYWHMLFRPFGAINLKVADMAPLIMLMLNRGRSADGVLLPTAAIERMERSETTLAARHGLEFGYGLGLYSWYHQGQRFFGHGGDGDGYLAHFAYNRNSGLGYCIIINAFTHTPLAQMRRAIEDFIVAQLADTPAAEFPPPFNARELPPAGAYALATRRFAGAPDPTRPALTLRTAGGQLLAQWPGEAAQTLIPVARWLWREADQPAPTVAIMPDQQGHWVFHGRRESLRYADVPGAAAQQ